MITQPVVQLFGPASAIKDRPFTGLMKRLGAGRFARPLTKPPPEVNADPHLLLLLADQELVEGREEQARYLVEAAYEFYDRKTRTNVCRLYLVGLS
jgi:hypothetical protein